MRFQGLIPALITPFSENGVDWSVFDRFLDWQLTQGVHGVVPCGTTGETPTLSEDEVQAVIARTVARVKGRIPVIAGTGSNATAKTIALTQAAQKAGADGALVVTPYYNKPTQEGLYQHFRAVHDATDLPIILYSVPGRTGVELSVETVERLSHLPRIAGIKDAHVDLNRPALLRRVVPSDFALLSGEDGTAVAFYAQGGNGCISVTANVAPALCVQQWQAWQGGDLKTVATLRDRLAPLHKALFVETNPVPVKYAASLLGLAPAGVRLPLTPLSETSKRSVAEALKAAGLDQPVFHAHAA